MNLYLALFGWTRSVVDGTVVYMHASGIVVYHQGAQSSVPDRRRRVRRVVINHKETRS